MLFQGEKPGIPVDVPLQTIRVDERDKEWVRTSLT